MCPTAHGGQGKPTTLPEHVNTELTSQIQNGNINNQTLSDSLAGLNNHCAERVNQLMAIQA